MPPSPGHPAGSDQRARVAKRDGVPASKSKVDLLIKTPGLLLILLLELAPAAVLAEEPALPQDVADFLAQREACDHWRGEPPWDKARAAQIDWNSCQACSGTDSRLAGLKRKYAANAQVISELKPLTPKIETTSTLRPAFCRSLTPPPGS